MRDKEKDEECLSRYEELKKYPRLFDWVDRWAAEKPNDIAIIEYNTGEKVTWKDFATKSKAFAKRNCYHGRKGRRYSCHKFAVVKRTRLSILCMFQNRGNHCAVRFKT